MSPFSVATARPDMAAVANVPAIILAAGQGTRLRPYTEDRPKCLVDIGGVTILEHELRNCLRAGVLDVCIVTGFGWRQIDDVIRNLPEELSRGLDIETVYNPFFSSSNNLISLWGARHRMANGFILINGDSVFDWQILERLRSANGFSISIATDWKTEFDDDDMKLLLDGNRIKEIHKTVPLADAEAESIGIMKFTEDGSTQLMAALEEMVRSDSAMTDWYTMALDRMARSGYGIGSVDIHGLEWAEIDFPEDLAEVRRDVARFMRD